MTAGDEMRRRLERNLHDGAQQRLVSLVLELRLVRETVPVELPELTSRLGTLAEDVAGVLDELRELARGLHPAILEDGGLRADLKALARRSAVPVELQVVTAARYPKPLEAAAYYVISEALTNTLKHSGASQADVALEEEAGTLRLRVRDDGVGGADPTRGSGLVGLRDRVEGLGGSLVVRSPVGQGTVIEAELPVHAARRQDP